VLISYGKNGNGAIAVKGSQNVPPAAGTDELVNVNVGGTGTILQARLHRYASSYLWRV
jgi:hypothetical protein